MKEAKNARYCVMQYGRVRDWRCLMRAELPNMPVAGDSISGCYAGRIARPARERKTLLLTDEVRLADVRAGHAQNVVGGGAMEEHVRQHKVKQISLTFELRFAIA